MNIDMMAWAIALAAVAAFSGLLYWLLGTASRGRMMRCPQTGAISIVQVVPRAAGEGRAPGLMVKQCDLWPQNSGCTEGCLARYRETAPGLRVNLKALRPFEP